MLNLNDNVFRNLSNFKISPRTYDPSVKCKCQFTLYVIILCRHQENSQWFTIGAWGWEVPARQDRDIERQGLESQHWEDYDCASKHKAFLYILKYWFTFVEFCPPFQQQQQEQLFVDSWSFSIKIKDFIDFHKIWWNIDFPFDRF